MMEYKIGQILTAQKDLEIETAYGKKVAVPKGSKVIIGADYLAHHLRDDKIQPLEKDAEVEGYDSEGLAEYLFSYLIERFFLIDFLEDYGVSEKEFKDEIVCALEDIGF